MSTKIHLATDAQGRPVRFLLTGGQAHDAPQAGALLAGFAPQYVLADKAYDADAILETIAELGAEAVIPPKSNRTHQRFYDRERYKQRNHIERTIGQLKQLRRPATRYDRKAAHFLAFLHLAALTLWIT